MVMELGRHGARLLGTAHLVYAFDDASANADRHRLRLFSLIPLLVAIFLAKALYDRYKLLLRGVSAISLASSLILTYPPLLALSLALLVGALILSIPFLALIFRLMLVGTFEMNGLDYTWKVKGWAWWMAVLVAGVWMWCWAVVRGVMRASVAAVVGAWYHSLVSPSFLALFKLLIGLLATLAQ
jgi:hypothetical protein